MVLNIVILNFTFKAFLRVDTLKRGMTKDDRIIRFGKPEFEVFLRVGDLRGQSQ
jgi:hypothetical protein